MSGGAPGATVRAAEEGRAGGLLRDALQTALRLLPWPTEPGLRTVGRPDRSSPVVVTGNYDLSVRRVARALARAGRDAWLVVAPAGGINVWCAAAGGHLGTAQVVTALKTSGVEACTGSRRAVLPQLAAAGVEAREVARRSGWRVRFGPVYAEDLPAYLSEGRKSDAMRHVRFGARERLEMAASWAVPAALLLGGLGALVHGPWALPLAGQAAALALAVFTLYDRLPGPRRLLLGAGAAALSLGAVALAGGGAAALAAALGGSALCTAGLTFDYAGSTPVEGGAHFEERRYRIALDPERCTGAYRCVEVCPEAVFDRAGRRGPVDLARPEDCIRCGACVVQCPQDALAFEDEAGGRMPPERVRRYKLTLLGRREVDAEGRGAAS